ncbi:MAG: argininosuccinate lyase [Peptococcaceae bacterium]|jgi:argininosuccinate lyase|nr:argininosuccinate lyase [Peptococcaceae bacterium]
MTERENRQLWGGRFGKATDGLLLDFHSSLGFDQKLYRQDIRGSQAHARMLGRQGIITEGEAQAIIAGLAAVEADIAAGLAAGRPVFPPGAEDIHMSVEALLIDKIGEAGKKLHTARSRNDQVALDARLYAKEEVARLRSLLLRWIRTLVERAEQHYDWIMPGFTHLQIAQPITLGHHLMAYTAMFQRDYGRLADALRRLDVMPLGSGALAGTTFPIDRAQVAAELGFAEVGENSLDGVSDRDYMVELEAAAALIVAHLSRFSEELILWASQQFGFVELDDAYSTGSSIMPQKKNPDAAELIRGKSGRVFGHLLGTLTMLKGLPLAYNKDMQEDKEAFFDTLETVGKCLLVSAPQLATARFRRERMRQAAALGFSNATDLADYLVSRGLAFRDAHHMVGVLVRQCAAQGRDLAELSLAELAAALPAGAAGAEAGAGAGAGAEEGAAPRAGAAGGTGAIAGAEAAAGAALIGPGVYEALKLENVVKARRAYGGTAPERVAEAIARAKAWLAERDG